MKLQKFDQKKIETIIHALIDIEETNEVSSFCTALEMAAREGGCAKRGFFKHYLKNKTTGYS